MSSLLLIPNLLLAILATIWQNREDWFFGITSVVTDTQHQKNNYKQNLLARLQQQGIDPNTL